MQDELVSFETAKLAKEKGFDYSVRDYYDLVFKHEGDYPHLENYNEQNDKVSIPTQSLLQRWLREKHNIHIGINIDVNNLFETNIIFNDICEYYGENDQGFKTYEESLEVGLKEALKLIKDENIK